MHSKRTGSIISSISSSTIVIKPHGTGIKKAREISRIGTKTETCYYTTMDIQFSIKKKTPKLYNGKRKPFQQIYAGITGCWHVEECK